MKSYYLFFLFFLAIPVSAGLFEDMLNQTYITNMNEMPVSTNLNPEKNIQTSGNIEAWVDIVGFKNTIRDGDNYYIQGTPQDSAIVEYDAWAGYFQSRALPLYHGTCYWCEMDSISKSISTTIEGGNLTAILTVTLKWHETLESESGTQTISYTEKAVFQDTEIAPLQYPKLEQPIVNITEYVNPIQDKISVHVNTKNSSTIKVSYGNQTAEHVFSMYKVENNTADTTLIDTWEFSGKGIGRIQDNIIIDTNISNIDYSKLNITVSNFYETIVADYHNYNITRIDYKPEELVFNPILLTFVGSVVIFGFSSYSVLRSLFK